MKADLLDGESIWIISRSLLSATLISMLNFTYNTSEEASLLKDNLLCLFLSHIIEIH